MTANKDKRQLRAEMAERLREAKGNPDLNPLSGILVDFWIDVLTDDEPMPETRYEQLFGSPERAARTLVRTSDERAVCKLPTWTASSSDYEAWLEWLRGDAE